MCLLLNSQTLSLKSVSNSLHVLAANHPTDKLGYLDTWILGYLDTWILGYE